MGRVLVVSTNYDETTAVLQVHAHLLHEELNQNGHSSTHAVGWGAKELGEHLAENTYDAIFWLGHGSDDPPGLVAQCECVALDDQRSYLIREKSVVCGTCYATRTLATAADSRKATLVGYQEELAIPQVAPYVGSVMDAVIHVYRRLSECDTAAAAVKLSRRKYRKTARELGGLSGNCYSLLSVPVFDRKKRLLALIKVENKLGSGGRASIRSKFSEADAEAVKALATNTIHVFEQERRLLAWRQIQSAIQPGLGLESTLGLVMERGLDMLGCQRADLALWDWEAHSLVIRHQVGQGNLQIGKSINPQNVRVKVWNSHRPAILDGARLLGESGSGKGNRVVFPVEWKGNPVGVLTVESEDSDWFSPSDYRDVSFVAQCAAVVEQRLSAEKHFRGLLEGLGQPRWRRGFLTEVLHSVREIYRFDGGLIYVIDHAANLLRCEAQMSSNDAIDDVSTILENLAPPGLVVSAFGNRRAEFEADQNRIGRQFGREAAEKLGIKGPLLGVPLVFNDDVVGVLVIWSSSDGSSPRREDADKLVPFAAGAAAAIAGAKEDARREAVMDSVHEIVSRMQSTDGDIFDAILRGVRRLGFDRARFFDFQNESFVLRRVSGMDMPAAGFSVSTVTNPYTRDTVARAARDPRPHEYSGTEFGPDPDAEAMSKPKDAPWVVVPLIVRGELKGQIVADNISSRRSTTEEMRQYLRLFGGLGAQAIEAESRGTEGPTDVVLATLDEWAGEGTNGPGDLASRARAIALAIRNDTAHGKLLVAVWHKMALDHIRSASVRD